MFPETSVRARQALAVWGPSESATTLTSRVPRSFGIGVDMEEATSFRSSSPSPQRMAAAPTTRSFSRRPALETIGYSPLDRQDSADLTSLFQSVSPRCTTSVDSQ